MRRDLSALSQVMGQTTIPPKTKGAKRPNWVEVARNLEIPKLKLFILWIFICNEIILPLKSLRTTALEQLK